MQYTTAPLNSSPPRHPLLRSLRIGIKGALVEFGRRLTAGHSALFPLGLPGFSLQKFFARANSEALPLAPGQLTPRAALFFF